jgi:hypothetical protein
MKLLQAFAAALSIALILMITLVFANIAHGKDLQLEAGLYTFHAFIKSEDRYTLNENNQFLSVAYRGAHAATFVNSYEYRSYALGYRWQVTEWFGFSVGAIHGYTPEHMPIAPIWIGEWMPFFAPDVSFMLADSIGLRARMLGNAYSFVGVLKF